MKRCAVNVFSKGREDYVTGTTRLINSLQNVDYKGDIVVFSPEYIQNSVEINMYTGYKIFKYTGWGHNNKYGNALPHKEASHQFKSFALQFAREQGYDQVIWMDSAVVVMKDPEPYFDILSEIGVLIFDAKDSNEAEWTADITLEKMGCSIEFARQINQCYSGIMMFDFRVEIANKIFDDFTLYCSDKDICNGADGSNRPEFKQARHDQSVISYCTRKHGLYNLNFDGYIWDGFLGQCGYNKPTFLNIGIGKKIPKYKED